MCMLFIKPKNLTLPKQYLESLYENNSDGLSCYDLESGELFQTMSKKKGFDFLNNSHDKELIVHFRYGTAGKKTVDQLHGWEILNGQYRFFHNGMLKTFNGTKDLSDTQQLIDFINSIPEMTIDSVVKMLENLEKSSRFLIVNTETKQVIKPNCAEWNDDILINGVPVMFSNTYAIDYHLLQDEGHTIERINKKQLSFSNNKFYYNEPDDFIDDIDYQYGAIDQLSDLENEMVMELDYLVNSGASHKEIVDYITVNPESAALYIREYMQ